MQRRKHSLIAGTFLLALVGLGSAEAYVLRDKLRGSLFPTAANTPLMQADALPVLANPDGVMPDDGSPVDALLGGIQGIEARPSASPMFLSVLFPDTAIEVRDLYTQDHFAGTLAWTESPDVKEDFFALKDALLPAFSPQLTGLVDTTIRTPGAPTRNILSFRDPALNPNTLSFVRVRNKLVELHAAPGMEATLQPLLEAVSTR